MNKSPDEIINEIFSFISYEDMVISGNDDLISLSRVLKIQYGTFSIIEYIRKQMRERKIFYVPLSIYDKIKDKLPLDHESFIYLTSEFIEKYIWNCYYISWNLSLTLELIEKYKDKLN